MSVLSRIRPAATAPGRLVPGGRARLRARFPAIGTAAFAPSLLPPVVPAGRAERRGG